MESDTDKKRNLRLIFCLLLLLVLCINSASAGLKVTNVKFIAEMSPGDAATHTMTLSLIDTESPVDISIEVHGLSNIISGETVRIVPSEDNSPYSAREYISLDKVSIHLNPGETQTVRANIDLPRDVGTGGRYAMIHIYTLPSGSGSVGFSTAVDIPVLITISGEEIIKTGKISEITIGDVTDSQPLKISTMFENTGNYYYGHLINRIEIFNQNDELFEEITTDPTDTMLLPMSIQKFEQQYVGPIDLGVYTVNSKILFEDGALIDEMSTSFEVSEEYVPPFARCSVIVSPGSPTELASSDGRCSISFPQGAVFGDTEVSLKAVEKSDLPSTNPDVKLGTTCFCVNGLSGLLSKDATLIVRYSEDDLAVAGGKPSLLKLGFFNEAEHQWEVMPTKVNENEMTLTTSTNHFSMWAVLASSSDGNTGSTTGSQESTPLSPILSLAALLVVAVGLKMRRER
ncbi:hypothetical protein L1S32_08065 [Methanogenium sp. S4BF]|uniref:hypothetical protein n=1 Tax=Methanogenium sp. S4BF TaxID=1789226 RepID=UPI00241659D6|nr:hypothetical protein [Methanogenium sp. S4BF]WFN33796.1 hypothetical protein L1S32_08065 [Methanogenium sp. S4BF]